MSATTMTGTPRGRSGRDRTMTVMTWIAPPILLGILIAAWEIYVATCDVEQLLLPAPHVIFRPLLRRLLVTAHGSPGTPLSRR